MSIDALICGERFGPSDPQLDGDLDARITAANERGCIRTQFAKRVTG